MIQIDIRLKGISHSYGTHKALDGIHLEVSQGELVALLGPSGCGKTTLLRIIAGLIPLDPGHGQIYFGSEEVSTWAPQKRNAAMVFQSYALFPHMTVTENIEYGLLMRKKDAASRQRQVSQIMEKVQLTSLGTRKIQELSGGQQQRVALARSLVVNPDVLLFDEPLSNLDEKLRVAMRQEIRSIQKESGITSVYVTHDQEEAMAIADRIVIMRDGQILQTGTPREVYEAPVNRFVASFMGECNFFEDAHSVTMCRPDTIRLSAEGTEEGTVTWIEYLGSIQKVKLVWHGRELIAEAFTKQVKDYPFAVGDSIRFDFNVSEHIRLQQ
ncbi:ABC transporter ATP-binding protein [Acidaminobacter hydrogenoformans]|uniref:Iron(III) transport system ATP-binding protein n=1 Tax=Acidaminobacter hydrogenoformans DSM 2784 TaxID=1120920 RepID=A0A1G5RRH0_9FIRM|nr:ABC transporter ATP-binding protein [Acidaminobacter hydrogenoformans]SCZ76460.1 iron(III) transport system ATP-binding protein [Acidaminobacter hydrogenoformans DSM 2784]